MHSTSPGANESDRSSIHSLKFVIKREWKWKNKMGTERVSWICVWFCVKPLQFFVCVSEKKIDVTYRLICDT